jgi:hypothetical protein
VQVAARDFKVHAQVGAMIAGVSSSIAAFHSAAGANARASGGQNSANAADPTQLSEEEQQEVQRLKELDREVRAHEQAHARAGGPHAGAPSYEYQRGPDGRQYAVSGEVQIDTAPISGNPSATISKMEMVIRAALAPQEPSAQDSRVAAEARAAKAEAQSELREQKQEEASGTHEETGFAAAGEHGRAAGAYERTESLVIAAVENAISVAA